MENSVLSEELKAYCRENMGLLQRLQGKTVFITGATGLIGSNILYLLLHANKLLEEKIRIIAGVRNVQKAESLFGQENETLKYHICDVLDPVSCEENIDYIIHAASQTSSRAFVQAPAETIQVAINGTQNLLKFAQEKAVKSFVFLSTMEVYGTPSGDEKITEERGTNLDTMCVRSCYPESKRVCEALCAAYAQEYSVPAKVVRLTQTFGPGVSYRDSRVFAEFARCAIEKRNIVLHTKGETKRNYLYSLDAAAAILTVLLLGENGEAYNAANEETYCSIMDMAQLVAQNFSGNDISVVVEEEDIEKFGYAPVLKMNLDTTKLRSLGWKPRRDLLEMFTVLISSMS